MEQMNLSELWTEARKYGRVHLFTHDDGTCSCDITFNSIEHSELKAKSGFKHPTPESAITAAINVAADIVGEMVNIQGRLLENQS